jgi:hypothetical protein
MSLFGLFDDSPAGARRRGKIAPSPDTSICDNTIFSCALFSATEGLSSFEVILNAWIYCIWRPLGGGVSRGIHRAEPGPGSQRFM